MGAFGWFFSLRVCVHMRVRVCKYVQYAVFSYRNWVLICGWQMGQILPMLAHSISSFFHPLYSVHGYNHQTDIKTWCHHQEPWPSHHQTAENRMKQMERIITGKKRMIWKLCSCFWWRHWSMKETRCYRHPCTCMLPVCTWAEWASQNDNCSLGKWHFHTTLVDLFSPQGKTSCIT